MKKDFHVFFLFVLFAFFAVNAAWAAAVCPEPLQEGSDGCFVNLTKNGEIFAIPEGVTSFKVYDDGGKTEIARRTVIVFFMWRRITCF